MSRTILLSHESLYGLIETFIVHIAVLHVSLYVGKRNNNLFADGNPQVFIIIIVIIIIILMDSCFTGDVSLVSQLRLITAPIKVVINLIALFLPNHHHHYFYTGLICNKNLYIQSLTAPFLFIHDSLHIMDLFNEAHKGKRQCGTTRA